MVWFSEDPNVFRVKLTSFDNLMLFSRHQAQIDWTHKYPLGNTSEFPKVCLRRWISELPIWWDMFVSYVSWRVVLSHTLLKSFRSHFYMLLSINYISFIHIHIQVPYQDAQEQYTPHHPGNQQPEIILYTNYTSRNKPTSHIGYFAKFDEHTEHGIHRNAIRFQCFPAVNVVMHHQSTHYFPPLLLMVQKSQTTTWKEKNPINDGMN